MRLSAKKSLGAILTTAVLCFVLFQIFSINRFVRRTLADEQARLNKGIHIPFEKRILTPHLSPHVKILQNTNEARDFIKFQDSYYAATSGGLLQLSPDGKVSRHFTVLDGLPESDLTSLSIYQGRLFIGTRTKSLVAFDGEKFEHYVWTDRRAHGVTAFLETDGRLLIGTQNGGLIEFDGENFAEIKAEKKTIKNINCLYKNGAQLFIGTFDDGLLIYRNDVWEHFTAAENGLPSNRIIGFVVKDKNTFVATDFGLAILEDKTFRTVFELPSLSSLVAFQNRIFLTKDAGEVFTFDNSLKAFATAGNTQNSRLAATNEKLWLISNQGIAEFKGAKIKPFGSQPQNAPTDNFVSAMTFDDGENFWVGTFRRGVDVFNPQGEKLRHLETEELREINYLHAVGDKISAATSSGLIEIKKDFSVENITQNKKLPSNSITHFSDEFVATGKGLAIRRNDRFRLISTVQGLPNNSVYATLLIGKKLYAGTLGGLAEMENGRVSQVFKDSNSNLATNWVTALCAADERIFIGTYGGGIFELMPSGEVRSFAPEAGKFAVNPNAIFSDGSRLYAGTLEGVKTLDLRSGEWSTLKKMLPSETVMSIAGDEENIYFGTTGGIARIAKTYFAKGEPE